MSTALVRMGRRSGRSKHAVDMTERAAWGELVAVEPTAGGFWRFRCAARGHVVILDGKVVRKQVERHEAGTHGPQRCPECRALERGAGAP